MAEDLRPEVAGPPADAAIGEAPSIPGLEVARPEDLREHLETCPEGHSRCGHCLFAAGDQVCLANHLVGLGFIKSFCL